MADQPSNIQQGAEVLKSFQIDSISIKDKSSEEYGLAVSQFISSTVYSGLGGYYFDRNARFAKNRASANGTMDVKAMFSDRFNYNGKQNYTNIGWQAIQIVNRIISGLVGRWMGRNEKIVVQAKDSISEIQKQKQFDELEFWIWQREKMLALQKASGVQTVPDNIPADMDELLLWQQQFQKIPEEIGAEIGANDIMEANGLFSVVKEKLLHDEAEVGFVGTYTWMDKEGVIHTDYVKPENSIYSYSEFPDFRDTTWRGEAPTIKISQLRKDYGVEFGGKLTEKDLWDIAATTKNYQKQDNITWLDQWVNAYMRPYDEWNADCIKYELKTIDSEKYTVTTTKGTGSTILESGLPKTKSGNVRQKPNDNQEVFEDTNWNIYRGVYLPQSKKLLEWGLKKNMIRPQDPKEIGNAEFSYSFYMYQNFKMRNIAIPEKIEQPVNGMILSLLKIEQVVAKSRPPGAMINWRGLQNMDFGLGDTKNKEIDQKKLFDQTGDIYYYDLDENDKPIGIPITEIPNAGFLPAIQGWIQIYQFHYQTLKDQLGEDPNLMSQALQPRVTQGNVISSQKEAENSTDYMYDGYLYVMEDTAKKVTCLMQKSILFGAKAYRHLLKEEQVQDRIFNATAKMLPTEQDIAVLNDRMNATIQSNPDICIYLDTFKVLQMAKEDVKLAERYYQSCMKKMLQSKIQQAQDNQNITIKGQQDSARIAEQEKRKSLALELKTKALISDKETNNALKVATVTQILALRAKGVPLPSQWESVENEIIKNVELPLFAENMANIDELILQQIEGDEQELNQMEQQPQEEAA
jgi:hypothetical protein